MPILRSLPVCSGLINIVISRASEKGFENSKCSNRQCCIFVIDRCAVLSLISKVKNFADFSVINFCLRYFLFLISNLDLKTSFYLFTLKKIR